MGTTMTDERPRRDPLLPTGDRASSAAAPPAAPANAMKSRGTLPITLIAALVVVIAAAAAFTAYWFFAIATLEERVAGWIEQRETEGWRIDRGAMTRSGFPSRLRLTLIDGSIAAPAGWRWASPRTEISLPVFAGWSGDTSPVDVAFGGEQRLSPLPNGPVILAHADTLVARLNDDDSRLPTGTFVADNLVVAAEGGAPVTVGHLEAASSGDPTREASLDDATFDLAVNARTVTLPPSLVPALTPALGERIERLDVEARLMGGLGGGPWPEAVGRWRQAGGTVEVTRLGLAYGPLDLDGEGTLALDGRDELLGAFSVTARGLAATVSTLAERGAIPPEVAAAARFLLHARARSAEPPSAASGTPGATATRADPPINVPVSIQDRTVFLGPLPIARLPALPWALERR
ncbi:MAG: DUF2125 domain-containing protein [Rhodospirillales bacterium]